jgi:hypothetical protein
MKNEAEILSETEPLEEWDPLDLDKERPDPGIVIAAQRREIQNILKSYTGYFDLFSEMLQNALDAVERRLAIESDTSYKPQIWVRIDMRNSSVSITDNGSGMNLVQFKQFMRPNFSFKDSKDGRGCKGVGATYLAYGFNHVEVATKHDGRIFSGVLRRGREWVEDRSGIIARPKVERINSFHAPFHAIDYGTSMTVSLQGQDIRPKNLSWLSANNAEQWLALLRIMTPVGGIYLCGEEAPSINIEVEVIGPTGNRTVASIDKPRYLYPHEAITRTADLRVFLEEQRRRVDRGQDVTTIPPKFQKLNGLWGEWTGEQILDGDSNCPIISRLEPDEEKLVRELGIKLYIFLTFSTDIWDNLNDKQLGIRKNFRLLHGGLQLATRHMPQGLTITIPMTNNIGFQNLAHVIIHFENAEPDLGRKGFQPNQVRVAEKLSVSAVTAFRKRFTMLRKPGAAKDYGDELKLNDWIKHQESHEEEYPLLITGKGLFLPTEELPIRSQPIVEQDVVALFNQMLSSGLIRGIQLIASSQYKQYDGLYRVYMDEPFERFILAENNPLGVDEELFVENEKLQSIVKVLEYKFTVDGLIEEIQGGVKNVEDISLVVAWEMGNKWKQLFDVTSYLDTDNVHHRKVHGTTHSFTHAVSGTPAFEGIILKDLINYLKNPEEECKRQQALYSNDDAV